MGKPSHYDYLVVCHLFYPEEINNLLERLSVFKRYNTFFAFNIATPDRSETIAIVRGWFPEALLFTTPKKGRDIGAKLFMINALLQLGVHGDYLFIVHDKKSPHLSDGSNWRNDLLSIIEPGNIQKIPEIFKDSKVGIIGVNKYIKDEYDPVLDRFQCTSDAILKKLIKKLKLDLMNFRFVAGSIFLIRFDIFRTFFSDPLRNIPDIIAEMESGNSLDFFNGTYIHSWERILSWVATSQGYKIYGFEQ